jgi:hypothetical protein
MNDPVVENYTSDRAESDQQASTTPAAPLPSAPLPSSPPSAVHVGTYLARCRDRVLPALRPDPDADRENARTPAQAVALLQILIERANVWRVLADCESGRPLKLAGSQLERVTGGLFSARVAVTCLDLLQRHGYVTHWVESAGRGAIRMVRLELAAVAHAQRVAGGPPTVDDDSRRETLPPRRETLPPRRHKEPTVPLGSVTPDRSFVARARGLPAANERPKNIQMHGQTDSGPRPTPDPDVDRGSDRAAVGKPSVVDRPAPDEFAAAAEAIRAWRTHDKCEPRKHARAGRPDVDVILSDKDYLAVRAAASAVADFGEDPAAVARAVARNMDDYHSSMDRGRRSRWIGSFGWHLDTLTDARNAAKLAQEAQDAVSTSGPCPNSPQIDPDIPDQHEIDTRTAVIERVDAMSGQEIRDELDAIGAQYDPGSRITLRYLLVSAIVEAAA